MSQIFEFIKNLTSDKNSNDDSNNANKSPIVMLDNANTLSAFNKQTSVVVDQIVSDLLQSVMTSEDGKAGALLELLDHKKCVETSIYLANLMENNFYTMNVASIGDNVKISKNVTGKPANCVSNNNCDKLVKESYVKLDRKGSKITKKQMCQILASHYVKILNLIASVLVSINPETNSVMAKINNLYTLVNNGRNIQIGICTPSGRKLVKNNILDEPGFKELLQLYLFHLMQDTETQTSRDKVLADYQQLVEIFVNADLLNNVTGSNNLAVKSVNNNTTNVANNNNNINIETADAESLRKLVISLQQRIQKLDNEHKNNNIEDNELRAQVNELRETVKRLSIRLGNNVIKTSNNMINENDLINNNMNANLDANNNYNINIADENINNENANLATETANNENANLATNNNANLATNNNANLANENANLDTENTNNENANLATNNNANNENANNENANLATNNNANNENANLATNNNDNNENANNENANNENANLNANENANLNANENANLNANENANNENANLATNNNANNENANLANENANLANENANLANETANLATETANNENANLATETANPDANRSIGNELHLTKPKYNSNTEYSNTPSAEELKELKEDIKNMLKDPSTFSNVRGPGKNKVQKGQGVKAIERFQIFMNKYKVDNPDVMQAYLALFNKALKSNSLVVDRICQATKSSGRTMNISVATANKDPGLKPYLDNYNEMKMEYVTNCRRLVDILENKLLKWDATMGYKIRDITSKELVDIESSVRNELGKLYANSHAKYLAGIKILDKYYTGKVVKATSARKN